MEGVVEVVCQQIIEPLWLLEICYKKFKDNAAGWHGHSKEYHKHAKLIVVQKAFFLRFPNIRTAVFTVLIMSVSIMAMAVVMTMAMMRMIVALMSTFLTVVCSFSRHGLPNFDIWLSVCHKIWIYISNNVILSDRVILICLVHLHISSHYFQ